MDEIGDFSVAQQDLTELATGLHQKMRSCDGEVCLELMLLLAEGERTVGALTRMTALEMPQVSTRLGTMKRAGLVACRVSGPRRYYSLSKQVTVRVKGAWCELRIAAMEKAVVKIEFRKRLLDQLRARWKDLGEMEPVGPPEEPEPEVLQITVRELAAHARTKRVRAAARRTAKRR